MEKIISVENLKIVGHGQCSKVYMLPTDKVIKVFAPFIKPEEMEAEQAKAKTVYSLGLPTPNAYDLVDTEEGKGLIYDAVEGVSMLEEFARQPERIEEMMIDFGRLGRDIHSRRVPKALFPSGKDVFKARVEDSRAFLNDDEYEKINRLIDSIPDTDGLVHGDYHPGNILMEGNKLVLIDLADCMSGNPIFDLMTFYTYMASADETWIRIEEYAATMPESDEKKELSEKITYMRDISKGMPDKKKIWEIYLKAYLDTDDQERLSRVTGLADAYSRIVIASSARTEAFAGKTLVSLMIQDAASYLSAHFDEFLGAVPEEF